MTTSERLGFDQAPMPEPKRAVLILVVLLILGLILALSL